MSGLTNESVMEALGWVENAPDDFATVSYWSRTDNNGVWMNVKGFSPTTNTDDALALVPDGYGAFPSPSTKGGWRVQINKDAGMMDAWVSCGINVKAKTLPLAICRALIELTQKEK